MKKVALINLIIMILILLSLMFFLFEFNGKYSLVAHSEGLKYIDINWFRIKIVGTSAQVVINYPFYVTCVAILINLGILIYCFVKNKN
ncbi:hypothetical protein ELD05_07250 [Caldicellulosiruptor changbaiensis]|uniref:Uncharacterized protein n=1 Tax=Caldicellulosiruptor changbaiensis TaxID=1222016 RepID=A0A3T0D5X3_9FIRM|nr:MULTISPECIES: hypothetical protein [Caldicellulosiruptor]AZT90459.1 hypothetical protein ELD05_07250 [Caldicellulosiruptor changbaiensis]